MAVVKLVEDYAIRSLRNDVRDSLMMAGEECVLLQLYHPGDPDATPCQLCGDDVYHSGEMSCTLCYGTTFEGGVRLATRAWALFTDHQVTEQLSQRGQYRPDAREFQTEAFPWLNEHDIVVRIRSWDAHHTPTEIEGVYELGEVTRRSLRTGNRFGQYTTDVVAQKARLSKLNPVSTPFSSYPILGQSFQESIMVTPKGVKPGLVLQPDVKVVYVPVAYEAAPGGVTPVGGNRTFAQTIGDDVHTSFLITHNLGSKDVQVSVRDALTDEEVDTDITHTSDNEVTVVFATAPAAGAFRVTIQGGS